MKNAKKLKILCDVDVCAIIYNCNDQTFVVWPSSMVTWNPKNNVKLQTKTRV